MTQPIPVPGIVFSAANKGGDYLARLQQLSQAIDAAITNFNAQLAAASTADQIRQQTELLRQQTAGLVEQAQQNLMLAYAAIGTAGNTAQFATQLANTRTIAGKNFNGTQNVVLVAGDVGARPATWVPQISDVPGLSAALRKNRIYALAGI